MALLKVKTESGIIEGLPGNNQIVSAFKGIPFAKPPVGELRWKAPQPVEPWEGELKAYKFQNIAIQPRFASEGGNTLAAKEFYAVEHPMSEDCLYLNVWTPAISADEKLPVGIYIHGGGFETGFSYLNAYDGESFGKRGIVIVTIPYRLNLFGFLANEDLEAEDPNGSTGNYGIMDQIAAVEWVKRNIAAFGGDPNNMTLFGQSAGGMSVQCLCQSPLMNGNMKRAIMQSGGGIPKNSMLDQKPKDVALNIGKKFFEFIGVKNIEAARELDANFLIDKYQEFKKVTATGLNLLFTPIVDGYVITESATDYFMSGKHDDIEYMVGCTADEMRDKNALAPSYEVQKVMAEKRFGENLTVKYLKAIKADQPELCKQFYEDNFGDEILASDIAWCENQVMLNRKPSYAYYFTYVPPGAEDVGAHHSVEHHFVFQTLIRSFRPYTGFDYDLSNKLSTYWANFIKTGNPNGDGLLEWAPYSKESPKLLEIAKELKMINPPMSPKVEFIKKYILGESF